LAKIPQRLVNAGKLDFEQGIDGDYRLDLAPHSIWVLKVTKAIDGLLFMSSCVNTTRAGRAPAAPCGNRCRKGEQR